jgi:hypothetical protein
MKLTLKMLKDLGVCDEAYAYCENLWLEYGEYDASYDYDFGMNLVLSRDDFRIAAENGGPGHATYEGWINWFDKLKYRKDAITYFNDHIVENTFRVTSDGTLHESLNAARLHIDRITNELRDDYVTKIVLNGVIVDGANETWIRINDIENEDLSVFDHFIFHDIFTGINHKIYEKDPAINYRNYLLYYVDGMILGHKNSIKIEQKYTDESGKYSIWVFVE